MANTNDKIAGSGSRPGARGGGGLWRPARSDVDRTITAASAVAIVWAVSDTEHTALDVADVPDSWVDLLVACGWGRGADTAYAKNYRNGKWYNFDDSYASEANPSSVQVRQASAHASACLGPIASRLTDAAWHAHACVRVCVRACVRACVRMCVHVGGLYFLIVNSLRRRTCCFTSGGVRQAKAAARRPQRQQSPSPWMQRCPRPTRERDETKKKNRSGQSFCAGGAPELGHATDGLAGPVLSVGAAPAPPCRRSLERRRLYRERTGACTKGRHHKAR